MEKTIGRISASSAITEIETPASKSVLNRALVLAATAKGRVDILCGPLCEDTRALLGCLNALGINTQTYADGIRIEGCGGNIPNANARLDVKSAGTAARFLPALLAFCGGTYEFSASEQMQKRPMEFLRTLERLGATVEYFREREKFPFRLRSEGATKDEAEVNTDVSTQYASALLLAASAAAKPFTLRLTGARTEGSYIDMTLSLLKSFGADFFRKGNAITVSPVRVSPDKFEVESDVSGACYFAAIALLCSRKVLLKRIRREGLQGDGKFLDLLAQKGLKLQDTQAGLLADGTRAGAFTGFECDFTDFSDQTLTAAALAPFASSPSRLKNVGHTRFQECDRLTAAGNNINALGGRAYVDGNDLVVSPVPLTGGTVTAYGDHRVAMAFAVAGAKTGNVCIDDPSCVNKTFEGFFEQLNRFYR